MKAPTEPGNPLVSAYSLAKRSGVLDTPIGRRLFKSAYFFYKRHIEDDLQDLLHAYPVLVRGGNVLDIGANIGYTATVLARAIEPGRKIFAFEPEPSNFKILEETAHRPELEGKITALQYAVGAEDGIIELWVNDHHHGDHRVVTEKFRSAHPGAKKLAVNLVAVDTFLRRKQENICFIKVDVQGYELEVCRGMQLTLTENPELNVLLEFTPSAMRDLGFEPSQVIDFFTERGFSIYQVRPRGQLSPGVPTNMGDLGYVDLLFSRRSISGNRES